MLSRVVIIIWVILEGGDDIIWDRFMKRNCKGEKIVFSKFIRFSWENLVGFVGFLLFGNLYTGMFFA